jgi:hypothetical protein
MSDWVVQADRFIDFNERSLLVNAGSVSSAQMKESVAQRYDDYAQRRRVLEALQANEEEAEDLSALLAAAEVLAPGNEQRPDS